jgi:hypothetical protein
MDEHHEAGLGWSSIVANLKTLLETGEALPQAPWEFGNADPSPRAAWLG